MNINARLLPEAPSAGSIRGAGWRSDAHVRVCVLLLLIGGAACGRGEPLVVEDAGPVEWRPADAPRVSIGVVDGDERYQLVQVATGWRHADGRIFVMDAGKPALLIYDSAGVNRARIGRAGAGPGEFRMAAAWPYRGDSIAVYDLGLRRVSIFDADGTFVRSFLNPMQYVRRPGTRPSQSCCQIRGPFADGSFIGHPPDDIPVEPGAPRHSTITLVRISPDGAVQDTLGTFDSALFRHDPTAPLRVRSYETSYSFRYALAGMELIGGNGLGTALVAARPADAAGTRGATSWVIDSIPLPGAPQPFTQELRGVYEAALREDFAHRPARYEGSLASNLPAEFPPTAPRFVDIQTDADRRIWLSRWTPRYLRAGAPVEYDVIERDGRHVAHVRLPADARLLWAGAGMVLLLERDALDVQYVRLYDLVRPTSGGDDT